MSQILLVDDNAIQAATRKAILTRAGRRVLVATSGAAALKMMAEEEVSAQLALIITDHLMPGMNGPEFVRRLRERMPDVPVVVLSGFPDAEREYRSVHVEFYLKPVPPETLIRVVNELLDGPVAQTA
jgi:CheY-like chemotaxis protein